MITCEAFINACQLYISAKPHEFATLQIKIMWVLGFMQSGMGTTVLGSVYGIYDHPGSTHPDPIELLYQDIYKAFRDPNKQATAIQEITTIKQGIKSGEEHVQVFKQCYMCSGYGETASIHKFKRSLNTPLLDKIMAVPDLPTTLKKWYDLVV
ncbi:hypothetical protein AMATHDRAFT_163743 [Amanita thiersii Skay4041]|uniref:Uncharacterized protein n=1 Tax=Amanita thiersii Skay4041 TaxID=703135 RepID=A0A2A9N6A0_9AGAR|nr:hypothetical protein AMATHDRAFT_163743 [Amanita thiersii Skay4041]